MELLVIGGTRFVGRHLVEAALARGHRITLFNRGRTNPGLFPDVEQITGDRDGGLDALGVEQGRTWDAVIDTCGYLPRLVGDSARLLSNATGHYTYISSISVYADEATPGQKETARVGTLDDPTVEDITDVTYGPLKALCEQEVERAFPGAALILRCGLIVGPHDHTDRFTYWVDRVARGGEVLVPDPPEYGVQVIDARDLGEWTVRMVEGRAAGTFNTTGPEERLDMDVFLKLCRTVAGSDALFTWVAQQFVLEQGVEPWSDLPMWLPVPKYAGALSVDVSGAVRAGLRCRPIEETIADTLAWSRSRGEQHEFLAGLKPDREAKILRAWRERSG